MPSRVDRTAAADGQAAPKKKQSGFSKLLFGMLIFIVGAQVAEIALAFADQHFLNFALEKTNVASASTPLLGSLSWFSFLYVVLILALYIAMYRFNIFPKDPFGAKAAAQARAEQQRQETTHVGAPRTRSSRRHAATTTVAAAKAAPSARRVAADARAKTAKGATATTTTKPATPRPSGDHDDAYERVKAAQRTRRRRDSKR